MTLSTIKPILILFLLADSLGLLLGAQTPDRAREEVLQEENVRVKAVLKADLAALDPILASDLTYCHAGGVVDSKSQLQE